MLSASFYTGEGFSTVNSVLNLTGNLTQNRSTSYQYLPKCEEKLKDTSLKQVLMYYAWKNFSGDISIDCRWSSPVLSIHGTVTVMDTYSNQVIEYASMTKVGRNKPTVTFTSAGNNIVTVGTIKVFEDIKDHLRCNQIKIERQRQ